MLPRMKAWSRSSTLVVISVAASESVRAMTRFDTPITSYWSLMAMSRLMCSEMGTRT